MENEKKHLGYLIKFIGFPVVKDCFLGNLQIVFFGDTIIAGTEAYYFIKYGKFTHPTYQPKPGWLFTKLQNIFR